MTSTLLKQVERLRYLAILLLSVCAFGTANAQISSDDINNVILVDGSMAVEWINDPNNPWVISEDGTYIRIPATDVSQTTTLSMIYNSPYNVEFTLDWYFRARSGSKFSIKIDGIEKTVDSSYSWESYTGILPGGTHQIDFEVSMSDVSDDDYYVGIKHVKAYEYKELEKECLKEGSEALTFVNDPKCPWLTRHGDIRSSNFNNEFSKSKISTTFTVDKVSYFTYECRNVSYYCTTNVYLNGDLVRSHNKKYDNDNPYEFHIMKLDPGTYTVEFENAMSGETGSALTTLLRNVALNAPWIEVEVNTPGQLVPTLVDVIGDMNVQDVDMLRIKGSLNDKDWEGIKQLKGVTVIDFTDTDITYIPPSQFYGFQKLVTVYLPETLKTIGQEAFYYSSLFEISMPNSVVSIDYGAFYCCYSLQNVKLSNSLTLIPSTCFCNTSIRTIQLPEGIKTIGSEAFSSTKLESIDLPESLTEIGHEAFSYTKLANIVIPKNVTKLGSNVFNVCRGLKEVTLNSYITNLYGTFSGCDSIQTIIVPSVTPPTVAGSGSYDPFSDVDKNTVSVLVPEFALGAYKADSYWFQFRNLKSSAEVSNSDFWAIHGHLKLNRNSNLTGTPSIEIEAGGILEVATDTPLMLNEVTYSNQEEVPAVLLNESNLVTATKLTTKFSVPSSNKWYFFSPVTDVNMADVTYPATDSWVIRYYDGARRANENTSTGNWVNMPANGTLKRGQGYIIQVATPGILYMPAATTQHSAFFGIDEAAMTLDDNSSEAAENAGWNFVGNPYPAFYDIYNMNLEAPITVWDGSTYRAYSLADDDFVLRPMQPFFVQKADVDLTFSMPRSGRLATSVINRTAAPRVNTIDKDRLRLNLEIVRGENEIADDYTRIVLNESASMAYERKCDASKFMSMDMEVAQIYSIGDNRHPLAINERPYSDGNAALGIYIPKAGENYRIAASRADRKAWLFDAVTGTEQDLTESDYIFTADKSGNDDSRFSIRFAPVASTAVEGVAGVDVKIVAGKGMLKVSAPAGADVLVVAADGSIISNTKAENGTLEIIAAAGVYVVKVNGQGFKTIVK